MSNNIVQTNFVLPNDRGLLAERLTDCEVALSSSFSSSDASVTVAERLGFCKITNVEAKQIKKTVTIEISQLLSNFSSETDYGKVFYRESYNRVVRIQYLV